MSPLSFCPAKTTLLSLLTYLVGVSAFAIPRQWSIYNDGIHLAVRPTCGSLSGNTADVNAGINLLKIKTIVSFGVSI